MQFLLLIFCYPYVNCHFYCKIFVVSRAYFVIGLRAVKIARKKRELN
jgi:hypothetical protein